MLSRMQVSRCCCDGGTAPPPLPEYTIDIVNIAFIWSLLNGTGSLDPIEVPIGGTPPMFEWGTSVGDYAYGQMIGVEGTVGKPIDPSTYTSVLAKFKGYSLDNDGFTARTTHLNQAYLVSVWNQVLSWTNALTEAQTNGIPRASMVGPAVAYNNTGEDWVDLAGGFQLGTLTQANNIAALVNAVVGRGDWVPTSSALVLVVEVTTQEPLIAPDGSNWNFYNDSTGETGISFS